MINHYPSLFDIERDAVQYIDPKLFAEEKRLYTTKWWDYKNLGSLQATYLFAEAFKHAIKEAIKRRKCVYRGTNYKGLKDDDFLKCSKAVITGLWKARQMADRLGIDYQFYCDRAMHYAERRDYRYLPSPQQIYSTKAKFEEDISMVDFIVQEWETARKNRLLHARSAFYSIYAFEKNRYQIEHQRFLLDAVKNRTVMRHVLIADLVYEKRLLPEAVILSAFENGESLIRQAKNFYL